LFSFSYSDFVSYKLDRKSTSGNRHVIGSSLVIWHNKKQVCVALSITEVEHIFVWSCCAQILWSKQQLEDYDLHLSKVPLMCDNTSVIKLTKI